MKLIFVGGITRLYPKWVNTPRLTNLRKDFKHNMHIHNFNLHSLSYKLLLPVLGITLVTVSVLFLINLMGQQQLMETEVKNQLENLQASFTVSMNEREQIALVLAQAIAQLPPVQQAFAGQDRTALIDLLHEDYLYLNKQYGIRQAQFHLPP
ncbi:MAG: hypothetical protein HC875_37370, partial [Anaerolineales bacterium]|nr:hypothetical protein [Anaerolineales bacterium]